MGYENILLEKKGNITTITINHPPANSWNLATMLDFEAALKEVESDKETRVIILTGSGTKCFSAGFDVSDAANTSKTAPKGREVWRNVDRFEKPIIAAINGHALGGGLELAMSCHFRIMVDSDKAKVGLTELNLGIIPGWGGTQRLMALVGKAKAMDMILFGKRISGAEALEIGLVNQLSTPEKLMDDAMAFAEKLAKRPPIAVACVLKAMSAGIYEGIDAGLQSEADGTDIVSQSADCAEGFMAFMQKREPVFKGE